MFPLGQGNDSRRRSQAGDRGRRSGSASHKTSNRATTTQGAPNQEKRGLFLDIDAARAQLGPTRLIEVFTSFKQAVSNHLLDMPEVRETIQTGRPVDIAAREIQRFQAE